ncbi:spermatogenesis-associated protein 48 [Sphaerodactylus townsendi]|uniref:spermatogenesis-associated protein 48 n=1 Tax=Sphaerodactylus townsendi TaxID=933632 RepID=UPI002026BBE9|nr:spermatogenesis-associated protein 48 [Sphaerodactylus townsendi]
MASQVPAKQFSPLKCYHTNEQPKMSRKDHEGILKRMYMPFVRGPEDRHYFPSFEDPNSNAFLRFGVSPEEKNYSLAPLRDDVPVTDTITEFINVGAEADQKITSCPFIESPQDGKDWPLPQEVAPVPPTRTRTARPLIQLKCQKQDQCWNSTSNPEVSLKAQAAKLANPVRVRPAPLPVEEWYSPHTFIFNVGSDTKVSDPSSEAYRDKLALKYVYSTTTQRLLKSFGIGSKHDLSMYLNGQEDKVLNSIKGHPPGFPNQLAPLSQPGDPHSWKEGSTSPAEAQLRGGCNTTPGYTGKVHWSATHPANSNVSPALPSTISRLHGYMVKEGQPTKFPHLGPLSRAVSISKPYNPFNKGKELNFVR